MPLPIHALVQDETIRGPLLLTEVKARKTRSGSDYLDLTLRDASGQISAKMWQTSAEAVADIEVPGPVQVVARVDAYQGRMQLVVEQLDAYDPTDEEYRALIPASAWPAELLWEEIEAHLRQEITDPSLWKLVKAVLDHPLVLERAKTIPAASHNHHAYRSGLAEHMLSMLRLTSNIATHYQNYYAYPVHRGLLATGVLLHDIGKIWELSGDIDARYTDEGKLLGHIFMAARWVEEIAAPLDIPRGLVVEVQHLILSHHGRLEFGSPKVPHTIEAMLLHHVDKLDADMNQWMAALSAPGWTGYQRNYQRAFLRPDALREDWTSIGVEQDTHYNTRSWTQHATRGPGYQATAPSGKDAPSKAEAKGSAPAPKESSKEPKEKAPDPNLALFDGLDD